MICFVCRIAVLQDSHTHKKTIILMNDVSETDISWLSPSLDVHFDTDGFVICGTYFVVIGLY